MANLGKIIALFFIAMCAVFSIKFGAAFQQYRNLYQKRMNPKFPFSRQAIRDAIENNLYSFLLFVPIAPFFWWKTIFQSISDVELKALQSKVRKYVLLFLLSAICMMASAALGFAAASHWGNGGGMGPGHHLS